MKKAIYIAYAALLLAGCASKKHAVKTESGTSASVEATSCQQTDSVGNQQTTTRTVELKTDSTTETLTFELTDSGSVEIAADGKINAKGVKLFTKQKKSRQRAANVAKTEELASLDYHTNINEAINARQNHWQKTDSLDREPVTAGTTTKNWLLNLLTIVGMIAGALYGLRYLLKFFIHTD